jgi:hypothetical protein
VTVLELHRVEPKFLEFAAVAEVHAFFRGTVELFRVLIHEDDESVLLIMSTNMRASTLPFLAFSVPRRQ